MKKLIILLMILFMLCGCGNVDKSYIDEYEGIRISIGSINQAKGKTRINVNIDTGDKELMELSYGLYFYDNDELVNEYKCRINGQEKVLERRFDYHVNVDNDKRYNRVETKILGYLTSEEMTPSFLPKKNEYLYKTMNDDLLSNIDDNYPIEVYFSRKIEEDRYRYDLEGYEIAYFLDLLKNVKIRKEIEYKDDIKTNIIIFYNDEEYSKIVLLDDLLYYELYGIKHAYELDNIDIIKEYIENRLVLISR